ncbi:hypothetical protein R1sor_001919 [Riccia sorocarpa]|uniref:Uncharacterized protein n=1 Tax=Riccia sorocarpa TaxID=122646 RepID=A0ABD3GXA6_9MARC
MWPADLQGSKGYTMTEKIQIPGMLDYRDEFHPQPRTSGEYQGSIEVPDDFFVPAELSHEFHNQSAAVRPERLSISSVKRDFSTPTRSFKSDLDGGSNTLSVSIPPVDNSNWDPQSPLSCRSGQAYFQPQGETSRSRSLVGDADQDLGLEVDGPGSSSLSRRFSRQLSLGGITRSSSFIAPKKTRSQRFKDYLLYEKGILESLLPLKAAVAATLASAISFAPFVPEVLRAYGTTAVVGVGITLEPTVGQTLQKGYNLALGSALAAFCAYLVFITEPHTGIYRVPFLIVCAFLGGCLPRMYNLPAVIKSRWGQVVSYYISVFHGFVLWNPLVKKQNSQFLLNCICYGIGFMLAFTMSLCIKPDYAGEELLSLLVRNFHTAGTVLERIVVDYKEGLIREKIQDLLHNVKEDRIYTELQFIMNSIPEADKLVIAVQWEPPHGKFYSGYPWNQYPKLLEVLLHVMYDLMALDSCLRGEIQAPRKVRQLFADDMEAVATECAELFHKLAEGLEQHKKLDFETHVTKVKVATRRLRANLSKFSPLVIAQDSAPAAYTRSGSLSSAVEEVNGPDGDAVLLALAHELGATAVSTPPTPATPPASPQIHERVTNDPEYEGVPQAALHHENLVTEDWRAEVHRKHLSAQIQWESVLGHWDETSKSIDSLSFLKFASILIELMAKVKTVVASVDDFASKARFKE